MSDPNNPFPEGSVPPPPGGGFTPPPPGPPSGGFTPPPPGGGFVPPPPGGGFPPPGGGYAPPPGYGAPGAGGPNATEAMSWGWKKFQEHVGAIAIAIAVWVGAVILAYAIGYLFIAGVIFSSSDAGVFVSLVAGAVWVVLIVAAMQVGNYGIIRGALAIASGRAPSTGEMFDMSKFVPFLLTSLLVAVITGIGSILCYLPGIAAMFLLSLAPYYAAERGLDPIASIKASYEAVVDNAGPMIVFFLLSFVAYFVGALLCGVGLLVAAPVVALGNVYMYRAVNNEPIAP